MIRYPVLLMVLVLSSGCFQRRSTSSAAKPDVDARLAAVRSELQALQSELSNGLEEQRGRGRGVYADGPARLQGAETVLERLRRTEQSLQEATAALDERTRALINLRQEGAQKDTEISNLSAKAERLDRAEERRTTAVQELNAARERADILAKELVGSELARLEAERTWYELATQLMRLDPSRTQDLYALQNHLREEVQQRQPGDPVASTQPGAR